MDEMKSSAVVVAVSVVDGAAVAVLVAVVEISVAVVPEAVVAVMLEVGITPASPARRGDPEVLNLWKGAIFEEEESVVKEAVLSM